MKKLALHWKIIIGMVLGVIWALLSSWLGWSEFTINWIDPFGIIFINLLKMIAVPLVLFSIISGVANIGDTASLGKMGGKTVLVYFCTNLIAIALGLLLVNSIKPGSFIDKDSRVDNRINYEIWASSQGYDIKDGLSYLKNPEYSQRVQELTNLSGEALSEASVVDKIEKARQQETSTPLQPIIDIVPDNFFKALSSNGFMLQIIFFAVFFGVSLLFIPSDKSKPVLNLVDGINEVFLKMVDIVMQSAPFFVFALLAGVVSKMAGNDIGKVVEIFKGLSWYSLTVLIGLALMTFAIYPLILKIFVKNFSYTGFFKAFSPALTLAFSTSSSAATLPVTMECVEKNMKIDKKICSFVLPIGATVNMDGTSLYQAIAVIFLAQLHMIDLTVSQQLMVIFTTTLASLGSAAVPSAGLVMLIIVLDSVGLNPAWIAIIFPVDRILDMFRTVVNVTGDAIACCIIAEDKDVLKHIESQNPSKTFDLDS